MYYFKAFIVNKKIKGKDGELIIVKEGDNVRLRCGSTGQPTPNVQWSAGSTSGASGGALRYGAWRASSIPGPSLEIPTVSRLHAGPYTCIAHNGIPPQANRTVLLEVHCEPCLVL